MINTLAKQSVQDWGLMGLKPMHRALVRRCVERLASPPPAESSSSFGPLQQTTSLQRSGSLQRSLVWYAEPFEAPCDALLAMLHRSGVLMVDREGLIQRVQQNRPNDPVLGALHCRFHRQIRLLWNWTLRGNRDLDWCTELSFDGVVHDPRSLERWLRMSAARAESYPTQRSSLLRDLVLPSFAAPSTPPR